MNFSELPIIPALQKALVRNWFETATEIQQKVIIPATSGRDILGSAQTWSGKTLSFVLPILQNLYNARLERWLVDWKVNRKIEALILVPTRELASQIAEVMSPYATNVNLKYSAIFGWVNDFHQIKAIEKWIDILIATPGRLEDLISQWVVKLSYVKIFTIDEADKMLDLWFMADVKKIIKRLPEQKQTFLFSATIPETIKSLAKTLLRNPENISVAWTSLTISKAIQEVYFVWLWDKRALLQNIIKRPDLKSIIVFVRTREDTDFVMSYIKTIWITCDNIHKDKTQNARKNAITKLKNGEIKVLVWTDLASRWIDIDDLSCVINYNIPSDPEDYIHRIWRTARAGKSGLAISFCSELEKASFLAIEKLINKKITVKTNDSYKTEKLKEINLVSTIKKTSRKRIKKAVPKWYLWKSFDENKVKRWAKAGAWKKTHLSDKKYSKFENKNVVKARMKKENKKSKR